MEAFPIDVHCAGYGYQFCIGIAHDTIRHRQPFSDRTTRNRRCSGLHERNCRDTMSDLDTKNDQPARAAAPLEITAAARGHRLMGHLIQALLPHLSAIPPGARLFTFSSERVAVSGQAWFQEDPTGLQARSRGLSTQPESLKDPSEDP